VAQVERSATVTRGVLAVALWIVVGYVALVAAWPGIHTLGWFGHVQEPGATLTVTIVAGLAATVCVLSYRHQVKERPGAFPVVTIVVLLAISAVLGFASYARCVDNAHPPVFTALLGAAGTIKGNTGELMLEHGSCPSPVPVALQLARISGMAMIFLGLISGAVTLLTSQLDRARIRSARRVTAIVDLDDDCRPLVSDVAAALAKRSRLALIVGSAPLRTTFASMSARAALATPLVAGAAELRRQGAHIIGVDLNQVDALKALPIWTKLDGLYLLSSSPSANLLRLKTINQRIPPDSKRRLPLIVRIDDPWQAEAWRIQQLGQSDTRWAVAAVGVYELTAARIVDKIIGGQTRTLIVCGTSPLALALCANLVRQRLERGYYTAPDSPPLPGLTIVAPDAEEFLQDHETHQQHLGLPPTNEWLTAVRGTPSMSTLAPLITDAVDGGICRAAVILTMAGPTVADGLLATRLASRFPAMPVFTLDPKQPAATGADLAPIIGQLQTFWPTLATDSYQAHDVFERAAMLIHERYRQKTGFLSEADKPWPELNEFYRGSNRRLVRNAFAIVEQVAEHSWDSFGALPDSPTPIDPSIADKVERAVARLRALGFERDAAMAMAQAEHESWWNYLRQWGWRPAPAGQIDRDEQKKTRPDLIAWSKVVEDGDALGRALTNLADTLDTLRQLGYRSRPQWQPYRRTGEVTAEQRHEPWSWTTESGHTMNAAAGDWEVRDEGGRSWSVRDDIFRATYEYAGGHSYRRTGFVHAREARDGETILTLEGPITAHESEWVLRGDHHDKWVVPGEKFTQRYEPANSPAAAESPSLSAGNS